MDPLGSASREEHTRSTVSTEIGHFREKFDILDVICIAAVLVFGNLSD